MGSKAVGNLGQVKIEFRGIEFDARQKEIGCLVSMFIIEQDVASMAKDEVGNRGDYAPLRSGQETRRMAELCIDNRSV